jgi:hypothetical protein
MAGKRDRERQADIAKTNDDDFSWRARHAR